uniref:Uncharacterized protein n=1 Tax=Arundo donax TaxID=35708 RepID=A0A0A9FWG1_ARUDO
MVRKNDFFPRMQISSVSLHVCFISHFFVREMCWVVLQVCTKAA